jgi:hypothetical protein
VLVDQPVYDLPAVYPDHAQISDRCWKRVAVGWALSPSLMRTMTVVVRQVLAQHGEEVWVL